MHDFLVVEVKTYKQSGKVSLTQVGLTKKVLNIVRILYSNNNTTPSATMSLVKDSDGNPFDETWGHSSVVVILMYLSRKSRPHIHFSVHQCSRFTHNPRRSNSESVNSI